MEQLTEYHNRIVEYYDTTENAYKDAWDLDKSFSIHYGYTDEKAPDFRSSLLRMNEVMMEEAAIKNSDHVLDAGCGIGGSSIFIAKNSGCKVTGITLSEKQVNKARTLAQKNNVQDKVHFELRDYCKSSFNDQTFDVVWGCESICYAPDKQQFINEAFRLLRPGGRLIIADGFVTAFDNNDHKFIKNWLEGWQVNYLESPDRFMNFMKESGFIDINYTNITRNTLRSAKRLNRFYYLASLYLLWKKITLSDHSTAMQRKNIKACHYQYLALRKGLWQYGLVIGRKTF